MYADNLKKLRYELRMSAQQLADKLGVSQGSISQYEAGKREPNYRFISQLNAILNVNLNWFVSGQGEMFIGQNKTGTSDADAHIREVVKEYLKDCGLSL